MSKDNHNPDCPTAIHFALGHNYGVPEIPVPDCAHLPGCPEPAADTVCTHMGFAQSAPGKNCPHCNPAPEPSADIEAIRARHNNLNPHHDSYAANKATINDADPEQLPEIMRIMHTDRAILLTELDKCREQLAAAQDRIRELENPPLKSRVYRGVYESVKRDRDRLRAAIENALETDDLVCPLCGGLTHGDDCRYPALAKALK